MNDSALPPPLPVSKPGFSPRCSLLGAVLAVAVIAACVVFVVRTHASHRKGEGAGEHPNRMLELMARYVVGVKELMRATQQPDGGLMEVVAQDITKYSLTDEDALRLMILKGWLKGAWPAEDALDAVAAKNAGLRADVETLRQMKAGHGEAPAEAWKKLRQRHGWLAELARAQTGDDKAKQTVAEQGLQTAAVLFAVSLLGMLAAVAGLGVLIWGIVRWQGGKLRLTLALRSRGEGGVLLEGFAIYLALFLLVPWLLRQMFTSLPYGAAYGPALVVLVIGMMWPRVRGMQRAEWREALGLHRGQGWWREMGVGILVWLASLPLLVVGMIAASWIIKVTGEFPSHPIVDVFAGSGWAKFAAILLAVVWAPVSEEIMFRGLLFPGLSAWLRSLLGALLGAFVFAAVHPQSWAGVPAIMALACSFSFLRLWRRSLIAPMTAHALNNGIMCVVMLILWS